jgi:AcrR family transcriptional regulator
MEKRITDRRVQKTRQALNSAFVELVLSRGYEAVTIGDICARADVGRSTFYSHYTSKEALLEESLARPSSQLAACVGDDITAQRLIPLLDHFSQQRAVNRAFFEAPIRTLWVNTLAKLIESRLPRKAAARPPIRPSLAALLVAELQIALITHWLTGQFELQPGAVAAMLISNTRTVLTNQLPDARARTSVALSVG